MQFIYPEFLFALAALAIPIIVHLFNFRRFRKIYFTNVRFLREIKQDTQSRSRLKHLLVLASRLLALAFLVLAFAQPIIPANKQHAPAGQKRISVYVDNSFSMDAVGKNGNLLETAKKKAREIAGAYKPSDQFQLLTTSFEGRHQRLVNRDEFLTLVDEIKPNASVRNLTEVIARQNEALSSGSAEKVSKTAYVISDFQQANTNLNELKEDSALQISLVPVEASAQNNLYIDTCSLFTPFVQLNVPNDLIVEVRNAGDKTAENIPVKLMINGVQKALASVTVQEKGKASVHLSFTISQPGWQKAQINIADYPVSFDDNFYFNFNVRSGINVTAINGTQPAKELLSIFGNDPYFNFRNSSMGQIDYSSFSGNQLIILNQLPSFSSGLVQELKKYVNGGGSVFIIPAEDASLATYNDFMSEIGGDTWNLKVTQEDKVSKIEAKHLLFADVFEKGKALPENIDLPVVHRYFPITLKSRSSGDVIMKMQSGNPFLISQFYGKGTVYSLATSLDDEAGSFPRHALFVPVFLRAALIGVTEISRPLLIGRDHEFMITDTLIANDQVLHLENKELKFDVITESRLIGSSTQISVHDQVQQAGNYDLLSTGNLLQVQSFNFDRHESDLSVYSGSELTEMTSKLNAATVNVIESEGKDLSHSIAQLNEGKRLWKYCIILTLIFLGVEILLIRFFQQSAKAK